MLMDAGMPSWGLPISSWEADPVEATVSCSDAGMKTAVVSRATGVSAHAIAYERRLIDQPPAPQKIFRRKSSGGLRDSAKPRSVQDTQGRKEPQMATETNVRAWTAAILVWAKHNNITVERHSKVDAEGRFRGAKLFVCPENPDSWRLSTLDDGPLRRDFLRRFAEGVAR